MSNDALAKPGEKLLFDLQNLGVLDTVLLVGTLNILTCTE